jgi:glucose-1-phosphate thymidylyltransferase
MKGILLAGGTGSRLYPLTRVASKHLQAVYDKPMVYYPLTVLMAAGIREICIITTPQDQDRFRALLGDGGAWGIRLEYRTQERPAGIAEAFLIAESFIGGSPVALMLGDNIFFAGDAFPRAVREFDGGATVFAYHVNDPERYGVVEFDREGRAVSLEEKPAEPKSNFAVPGAYLFDAQVVEIVRRLRPSARGELEITDVNRAYLAEGRLRVVRMSRGTVWLDAGTSSSLHEASSYVETIERRQGMKLGCPEEAALRRGFLSLETFETLVAAMPNCEYRDYLSDLAAEVRRVGLTAA